MIKIANILYATDFSPYADRVLEHATTMARLYNSKLYMVHVIRNPADKIYGTLHGDYHGLIEGARKKAAELMARYDDQVKDLPHEAIYKEGDPVYEILRVIDEKKIDLVVIGSHGEGPLEHLLMGSTCDKVVRSAPCPVLVVRYPRK
jgi:nucleotide-binding universal stress UspA family protein